MARYIATDEDGNPENDIDSTMDNDDSNDAGGHESSPSGQR